MENKLKVGQTFEVVEVLTEGGYLNLYKVGGHSIITHDRHVITNGIHPYAIQRNEYNQHTAYMTKSEVKPIGILIVTKVK